MGIAKITEVHGIEATELIKRFENIEASLLELNGSFKENPQTKVLTRQEVAEFFGVSLPTLHSWCKKGIIVSYRIGNKVRFKQSDVLEALRLIKPHTTL